MKKTYISPKVKCIELMFEGLIAESNGDGGLDGGNTGRDFDRGDASYSNHRTNIWGDTEW